MVHRRTLVILALAIVAIVAVPSVIWIGLRAEPDVGEGRHEPVEGPGDNPFTTDLKHLSVKGAQVDGASWCTTHAVFRNGTYALFFTGACDEPEPVREAVTGNLSVAFRLDDPYPVRLAPNATLTLTNTFHASYQHRTWDAEREDLVWDNTWTLDRNASWFEVHTVEHLDGRVSGAFHLEFEKATGERVALDGTFPKPHRRAAAPDVLWTTLAVATAMLLAAPRRP